MSYANGQPAPGLHGRAEHKWLNLAVLQMCLGFAPTPASLSGPAIGIVATITPMTHRLKLTVKQCAGSLVLACYMRQ